MLVAKLSEYLLSSTFTVMMCILSASFGYVYKSDSGIFSVSFTVVCL